MEIKCHKCGEAADKEKSRKWKGDRYCKKCYKKVSKEERGLMGLAARQ